MRTTTLVTFFSITFLLFSCQTSSKKLLHRNKNVDSTAALLWKVEGNKLKSPSFVFGTIHIIKADKFFISEALKKSIAASKNMIFEIDMTEMENPVSMMDVMTKAYLPDNQSLENLMSEEDYLLVKNHFENSDLPFMLLKRIKPLFLSVLADEPLSFQPDKEDNQSTNVKSYEVELFNIAQDKDMKVSGLETLAFQMSIFDRIPLKEQAKMLVESIKDVKNNNSLDRITEIYLQEDIQLLKKIISEQSSFQNFEDILLTERNINWIPIMEELMIKESSFFAVGAGHLAGKNGVLNLLTQKGYTVSPIKQ